MNAGPNHEYLWVDSQKKSLKLPACQYVHYTLTWVQQVLRDETQFPTRSGSEFPRDFLATIRNIFKHLFRVLAHIYHSHFEVIVGLTQESHLNTLFSHFVCFAREFDLIEKRELASMAELIEIFESSGQL
ncbi:Maintenance of ploidy protein mob2 [Kappamyces sp. JEL0829]|nr:Maintenance of ploidy protein mob2 [Kappamyces sp. JEL0829]